MARASIEDDAPALVRALDDRTRAVASALAALGPVELDQPSLLPGWTRLTIACHVRYCARTMIRLTTDALVGQPTSYYPLGRSRQRPSTLRPEANEAPTTVVHTLTTAVRGLVSLWTDLPVAAWHTPVEEPADNRDLGTLTLGLLAMAALTEFEVHGRDLDLALPDWSPTFVRRALPARIERLNARRSNHRPFDATFSHRWLLDALDGPGFLVSTAGADVVARPATPSDARDTVIRGSTRDLLALLLGRPFTGEVSVAGDAGIDQFQRCFPGP